ncbi:hypothetical protein DFH11DRAFT_455490 [Phellopilus nigrolimitatus]|nr:hypothetical protein DFH11DRAFT_455490 [Phellopilus nigrolimitatus]
MNQSIAGLSIGSILVASWFAIALTGVLLFQAYMYYRGKPHNEHKIFGSLVIVLLLLDMAHAVCIMATLYHYLIKNFGNDDALKVLVPPLALTVGLTATITFLVQSFFSWRVWKLSKKNMIAPFILLLQTARLACGWTTTVKAIQLGTFVGFATHVRWIFTAGVALSVACDFLITGSLCFWLHSSRSGLHAMDAVIDKIILYSIENGLVTSMFSVASLLCAVIMPGNLVFIAIHFIISKLYINSLLASLNSRNAFRIQKERQSLKPFSGGLFLPASSRERGTDSSGDNSYVLQSPRTPTDLQNLPSYKATENKIDSKVPPFGIVIKTDRVSLDEPYAGKDNLSE